jgi:hypothetical protein
LRVQKDGTAYWLLGSIVEVSIHDGNHDPNTYRARCLTGGTFPKIQVLHEKYPEPMQGRAMDPPFVIWREIAESEEQEQEAIEEAERLIDETKKEHKMFVIVGQRKGNVRVVRKEDDEVVKEGLESIEAAAEWIDRNECEECGRLVTDAAEGCSQRHIGAPKEFSF